MNRFSAERKTDVQLPSPARMLALVGSLLAVAGCDHRPHNADGDEMLVMARPTNTDNQRTFTVECSGGTVSNERMRVYEKVGDADITWSELTLRHNLLKASYSARKECTVDLATTEALRTCERETSEPCTLVKDRL